MTSSEQPVTQPVAQPGFRAWMGSMWLYTLLRFGLFGALWAVLSLLGLPVFGAALLGLLLSVPLSFVLLARPRRRFANQIELRMNARRTDSVDLAAQLDPDAAADEPLDTTRATTAARAALAQRRKRR